MLVDGRPEARMVTSLILQNAGYTVVTAAGVQEAIALLRRETMPLMVFAMILEGSDEGLDCYRGAFAIFEWLLQQEQMMSNGRRDIAGPPSAPTNPARRYIPT